MEGFVGPMAELFERMLASGDSWDAMLWAATFEGVAVKQESQRREATNPLNVSADFSWGQSYDELMLDAAVSKVHNLPGTLKDQ